MIIVAPLSAKLTSTLGARVVTAAGLFVVATGLGLLATVGIDSSDLHVAAVLFVIAAGIGLAGTPTTDAIMGALPKDQFGVGSAVADTTRELGGALGVAILGSVFAASYSAAMAGASARLPLDLAAAARESLAGTGEVAGFLGGSTGETLLAAAQTAFVDAMRLTSLVGVAVATAGAVVAMAFLPSRTTVASETEVAGGQMRGLQPEPDAA